MPIFPRIAQIGVNVVKHKEGFLYVPEEDLSLALAKLGLWKKAFDLLFMETKPREGWYPDSVERVLETVLHGK